MTMACSVCNNLSPETLKVVKDGQFATIFVEEYRLLLSARDERCPECKLLFDAISLKRKQWAASEEHSLSIIVNIANGKPLQIVWNKAGIFLYISRSQRSTDPVETQNLPAVIGRIPPVSPTSESEACLSLVQSWYLNCKNLHPLCRPKKLSKLPTRVVDLGVSSSITADVALLESSCCSGDYLALSYCWGNPKVHNVLKTTRGNLNEFKGRIAFTSLPLTLQHAIILGRRLNFRYIWIDALCIIQDDKDDWRREAAKMCDIYSGAAITIVACRADGSSGGIFGTQSYSSSTQVPYKNTHVNVSDDYGRDHEYNILLHERAEVDPVHTRAWTMQEAILSNRALFFTSQELRWECNSARACECGKLTKSYPSEYSEEEFQYENYRTWRLNDFFPATSIEDAYDQWSMMYTFYTARVLTHDSDRLVALSGLARRFAELMKANFNREEQYLAGVWRGSLPRDLLWHIEFKNLSKIPNRRHERPKAWRAPSWSWSSMEADAVRYRFGDMQSLIEVLDASTELAGPDPYGQVKAGPGNYLQISGPMLRDVRFNFDPASAEVLQRKFPTISYDGEDLRIAVVLIDDDRDKETDEYLRDVNRQFAILIVGYSPGGAVHESLLLSPVAGKMETFERVGMVRLGPHFREPKENVRVIESAPQCVITLV